MSIIGLVRVVTRRDARAVVSAQAHLGRVKRGRFVCGLAVGCLIALSGCGSSSQTSVSSTMPAASPPGQPTAAPDRAGSKAAWRVLTDAAAALRDVHGYVMRGVLTQGERRVRLDLRVSSLSSMDMTVSTGVSTWEIRVVPAGYYLRANAVFWRGHFGARAAAVAAGHWLQVPSSSARTFTSTLRSVAPGNLSRCMLENHGALSIAGRTRVDGRSAIVIRDAGNAPGSTPSLLAIAAKDPRYPLWVRPTGSGRSGGHIDVCNDGHAGDMGGSVTFGDYGRVPAIQAPKDVLRRPPSA